MHLFTGGIFIKYVIKEINAKKIIAVKDLT